MQFCEAPAPHLSIEDCHLTLGSFPSFTGKSSTLTIVLSSIANTNILDDFSIHIHGSRYNKRFDDAI